MSDSWRTSCSKTRGGLRGVALLISVSLALAVWHIGCSGEGPGRGGFSMPPMPSEVVEAQVRNVEENFQAVGTIEAVEAVTVVSEIDGIIVDIPYREGGFLSKGDLIAQIDDAQLQAEVSRVSALLAQSRSTYERVKAVVDQAAAAPQDLDDAAAALKVAEANLALARARHAKTRITAPFNGIAGARKVSVGTFVRVGQAITELANIDNIRVNFSAPERMVSEIRKGAEVSVSTTAYPGYTLKGEIIVIEPVIDPVTRNTRVVAQVPNPDRKFRSGMSADITTVLSSRPNAVTIPNEAVFASGDQSFVFVVNPDSTVTRRALKLGTRLSDVVEVLEGLEPGTRIVRAGHQKLFEGAKVMPIPPGGMPGQGPPGGARPGAAADGNGKKEGEAK